MPKFFQNTRYLEHVNINKYLSYTGVNRPGDGPCPLAAYLVTGTGSTSFFGEKYTSGVGDGSLRTLYYGSLLRETMGLTSTKNKYLFVQWDGDHRDLYTGPRSLDYNSLLLHLKIPIHTPRSSFCVWAHAYNMIQLQCLMNELNRIIWKTALCCCIGVNNYIQLLWEA